MRTAQGHDIFIFRPRDGVQRERRLKNDNLTGLLEFINKNSGRASLVIHKHQSRPAGLFPGRQRKMAGGIDTT